ncbi:hypothetical protein ACSS6W_010372 [Trichoderma asperelloides]
MQRARCFQSLQIYHALHKERLTHHSTKLLSCLLIVIIVEDYAITDEYPAAKSGLAR